MAREDLHFRLRIPEDLKLRVEAEADRNQRSMTAEIIDRLDGSFDRAKAEKEHFLELVHELDTRAQLSEVAKKAAEAQVGHLTAELEQLREQIYAARAAMMDAEERRRQLKSLTESNGRFLQEISELKGQLSAYKRLKENSGGHTASNEHLTIRLPEDLAEAISKAAETMRRTMEDQAIDTLEKSYVLPRRLK